MKQLICEMCGSADLIKQGGVFVCQSCGTKYSVEEARKMMIEGTVDVSGSTVRIDKSENVKALLERAIMALKDEEWKKANKYCEQILDLEPKNADAYLVKLMSALGVKNKRDLARCKDPFDGNKNYEKIMSFGTEDLREELSGYVSLIKERNDLKNNALKQKVDLIVEAFNKERGKNDITSKEATIIRKKAKLAELLVILEGFDAFNQDISKKQKVLADLERSMEQLSSRRESLGLFAGKEKKHIDEQLITMDTQKTSISREIKHMYMQHNTGGYTEKSQLEHDIIILENWIQAIEEETKNNNFENAIISIEEAIWLYTTSCELAGRVDKSISYSIHPFERFVSGLGYNVDELDRKLADRFADANFPSEIEEWELDRMLDHVITMANIEARMSVAMGGQNPNFRVQRYKLKNEYKEKADVLIETMIKRGIIGAVTHKIL